MAHDTLSLTTAPTVDDDHDWKHPFSYEIAHVLLDACARSGMSQGDFARRKGLKPQRFSRWKCLVEQQRTQAGAADKRTRRKSPLRGVSWGRTSSRCDCEAPVVTLPSRPCRGLMVLSSVLVTQVCSETAQEED
jgi:hypothetical protein